MLGFLGTMNEFLSTQHQVMQAYLLGAGRRRFPRIAVSVPGQARGSGRSGSGSRDEGS